jgi:nicotinate-nucleotide pyrophosphorylase (carboxylating)
MVGLTEYLERRNLIERFLEEDIGSGDITSSSIVPTNKIISAIIRCNALNESVTCGLNDAQVVFDVCNCEANPLMNDGSIVTKGDVVMQIRGEARSVLMAERTALNLIMRMSGIASLTRRFVNLVEGYNPKVRITGTRKTAPGLRYFDKKAIKAGGGYPHRMRLDEMVIIKDNHLVVTDSIEYSIRTAKSKVGSAVRIECEVRNTEEAILAAKSGANVIMFDNFTPSEAESGIKAIREFGRFNDIEIELSGGITLSNVVDYTKAQPDLISVGQLTHSPAAVDYSLEVVKTFEQQEL